MSVDFFLVTKKELSHPRPDGLSPEFIWFYRMANVVLNCLNLFW